MASACQQRRICYGLLLKPGQCTTRQQETSGDVEGHASVRPANGSHLGLEHDLGELSIVDLAITVQVSLSNHAVDGLLIHRVTHGGEHVDELLAVNEAGAIRSQNSSNSMVPDLSLSTSSTRAASSASVGFWPRERSTVPMSAIGMEPVRFLSKRLKFLRNSFFCSSVNSIGADIFAGFPC